MCDSQQIVGAVQVRWLYISWGKNQTAPKNLVVKWQANSFCSLVGVFLLYSKVYIKCLNEWLTGHICIVS